MTVTERLLEAIACEERAVLFTVIEGDKLGAHVLVLEAASATARASRSRSSSRQTG